MVMSVEAQKVACGVKARLYGRRAATPCFRRGYEIRNTLLWTINWWTEFANRGLSLDAAQRGTALGVRVLVGARECPEK